MSGLALALFLPAHFLALGTAIDGEAKLEGFLRWTEQPLVKLAEWILVMLLAAHLAGGLRLARVRVPAMARVAQGRSPRWAPAFAVAAGLAFALAR